MPIETIPSRFREHLFAQVAPHIGAALNAYPGAVAISPTHLAIDTLRRRLLEGIQAKKLYSWKHPSINESLWTAHVEELSCVIDPLKGVILLGTRTAFRDPKKVIGEARPIIPNPAQPTFSSSEIFLVKRELVETICELLHSRAFSPAPIVLVKGLSDADVDSLQSRYDIAILPHENDPDTKQIMS